MERAIRGRDTRRRETVAAEDSIVRMVISVFVLCVRQISIGLYDVSRCDGSVTPILELSDAFVCSSRVLEGELSEDMSIRASH
jgi:hypothetical protein